LAISAGSISGGSPPNSVMSAELKEITTRLNAKLGQKTVEFWSTPFHRTNAIILPRQARDKRRESTQTKHGFCFLVSQGRRSTRFCSTSTWTEGTASHTTATGQFAASG